jgi:tetratricopeptide (TPR) repeat protein
MRRFVPALAFALISTAATAPRNAAAQDSARVAVTLSSPRVQVGEPFILQIRVETSGAAPRRVEPGPLPPGLEVVRTQDYSELQFSYPGGRQRRYRREIVITARTPGQYTLPPARVEVDGQVLVSEALAVTVESARTSAPGDPLAGGRARLHATVEPATVYVGQQALLRVEALIPETLRPRRARPPVFEAPTSPGVWAQELPQNRQASVRLIGPEVVESYEFSRALFPLSAGTLTLPPATIVFDAATGAFGGARSQRLDSDSVRFAVRPLPEYGRPPAFRGAVGRYTLAARLEPASVRAGEPATLIVEVRGEGNVKGLPPPALPDIPDADIFDAPEESESWASDGVIHGARRFRWFVVPLAEGPLEIAAIDYPVFDPFAHRYETLATDPLRLEVSPGADGAAARAMAPADRAVEVEALRQEPAGEPLGWVRSRVFIAVQFVPLLALLAVWARTRRGRAAPARGRRVRPELARRADEQFDDADMPPSAVHYLFTGALAQLTGAAAADVADAPSVRAAFRQRSLPQPLAEQCAALLDVLAAHRFGGSRWDAQASATVRRHAATALDAVRAATASASGTPAGASASSPVITALLAGALALAAQAHAAADGDFARGVAAFEAGDHVGAVATFAAHVNAAPHDPAGWYNLGSAHAATGRPDRAVPAWLEALQLQPRAADVRARLDAAGAEAARRTLAPPLGLNGPETALAAAAAWWLLAAGLLLLLLKQRLAGTATAGTAALALILLAGNWAAHRQRLASTALAVESPTALFAAPALRAEPVAEVRAFTPLRVIERRGGWLRVRSGQREGWIEAPPSARRLSTG